MATESEVKKALTRLIDAFAIYNKDPEAIRAFTRIVCEKLSPFPVFIVDRAIEKIIDEFTFMPKIAEMLSACWHERDNAMGIVYNKVQDFKGDWHANKIHDKAEWEALRDEYLKLNAPKSAAGVMDEYQHYSKPGIHMPEEVKKKIDGLLAGLEVK